MSTTKICSMELKDLQEIDWEAILFYAFRYALGRSTYAVWDVSDAILKHIPVIRETTLKVIASELRYADKINKLGMDIDKQIWLKVKKEIEDYLAKGAD